MEKCSDGGRIADSMKHLTMMFVIESDPAGRPRPHVICILPRISPSFREELERRYCKQINRNLPAPLLPPAKGVREGDEFVSTFNYLNDDLIGIPADWTSFPSLSSVSTPKNSVPSKTISQRGDCTAQCHDLAVQRCVLALTSQIRTMQGSDGGPLSPQFSPISPHSSSPPPCPVSPLLRLNLEIGEN